MPRPPTVFTSSLVLALVAFAPASRASVGDGYAGPAPRLVSESSSVSLYPANVECKNFDKTGYKTWQLRDRSTVDLGNWAGAFLVTGAIEPGLFVSNGVDLFDVLQIKCGLRASEKTD